MDLLADPAASYKVPAFPLGMVLRDEIVPGHVSREEIIVRIMIANVVLRIESLERRKRELAATFADMLGHALRIYTTESGANSRKDDTNLERCPGGRSSQP